MAKVTIKENKNKSFSVSFNRITGGELLALKYALENHETPVGQDMYAYLKNTVWPESLKKYLED